MDPITAVVITYNEARNIQRCIASLKAVADEIIIVDSCSTDDTVEICKKEGVTVIQQEWIGFGPQKNLGNNMAAYDYILSLDADEELDDKLIQSILIAKKQGLKGAYMIHRLNYYYGKFIHHGDEYPDKKIRLFNHKETSWNNELVHETLNLAPDTPVTVLPGKLLHYTYYRIAEHINKANKYTTLAADNMYKNGRRPSVFKIVVNPFFAFFRSYFLKLGFLDGVHGFILAVQNAHGTFLKYIKLWEICRTK
ncbi:MAG: glycosyltransferase family 2 protein [Chitinophagaceae bacterium]